MPRYFWMITVTALALTGCDISANQDAQYDDSRNPFYKQAQQDLDNNEPAKAAIDYEKALGENPKLTEAHYQLGHIYGDKLSNPVGAVFHYQQYLVLVPTGDKAEEVKALIGKESQTFAASLPNSSTQSAADIARLQADNAALKRQVDDASATIIKLQAQLKHHGVVPAAAPVATDAVPAPAPDAAAPAPGSTDTAASTNGVTSLTPRAMPIDTTSTNAAGISEVSAGPSKSYTVVKGDSIWKIAHKMYPGDIQNGMEKIKDANKQVLGKPLKIGQVLVIPE